MSWRTVVITGNAKLDYKMDYMVVRKSDMTTRIYIGEIGMLIIESTAISLTTMLLCELTKHKIKIVFCDEKHNPQSELAPYYGSHDTSAKIRNQIQWSEEVKENIWTEIVLEKIRQQSIHLKENNLEVKANTLTKYLKEIELGDKTNREGHAAKVYFNYLMRIARAKQDKYLPNDLKQAWIEREISNFYELNEKNNFIESEKIIPVPEKLIYPDKTKDSWKQSDLLQELNKELLDSSKTNMKKGDEI